MDKRYNITLYACFIGYIVQAIVNNFVPLLFLTFHNTYNIPMTKITLLITFNFGLQLLVDVLSVTFVDRIGYRLSMIIAHICAVVGFVLLTILPDVCGSAFVGLIIAVAIYAVGGGLLEVLVSPIVEVCPTVGFIGCGLCGLSVGIMWPGVFSKAAASVPKGGTAMFAFLALAGDVGCAGGPTVVGMVSGVLGNNLKMGILAGVVFPVVLLMSCYKKTRQVGCVD
jgi:fucose permease